MAMMMTRKKVTLGICGLVAVIALVAGSGFAERVAARGSAAASPTATDAHSEIRAALKSLREAKASLELAKHETAGHRDLALKDTDEAIAACEEVLKGESKKEEPKKEESKKEEPKTSGMARGGKTTL